MLIASFNITASADSFIVDGLVYYPFWNSDSVAVGAPDKTISGDIVIPSSVTYGGTTYSVTSIAQGAFSDCTGLTSVTIGNSVTFIADWAFCGCSGLTSVTIPSSVTFIGYGAFLRCSGLTSVTIPNSVTFIGGSAFYSCSGLTSIVVESGNLYYDSRDNCNAIIKTAGNTLTAGCKTTVIPNSVTAIGGGAFYDCTGLTSVTIPNSVTSIGNDAFSGCSGLTSVTIGNSVTSIGGSAFCGCAGLTSVTIPNSVTTIGNDAFYVCSGLTSVTIPNSVTTIGNEAFYGCSGLTSVTIGNSVSYIGGSAFSECSGLTSVTIPNSVTSIGGWAFFRCYGLTSVTIGNSVTSIGDRAFADCSGLTSIKVETGNTNYDSRDNCNAIIKTATNTLITGCKTTTIPNSVTSIGGYAFYGCSGLTSVTIPNSVTSIGGSAFFCSGLTSIKVETGNTNYDSRDNCNAIIETATNTLITGCKTTTIPNSVTSIGESAFYGCTGLTSVTIPNSVITIGGSAFDGCSGLTSVTIPNSVTSIGNWAFSGCSGLTSVTIGNSVTSIGNWAFSGCSGLTSVTIPNSVTTIGSNAFQGCSGLTSVTIPNSVTSIGSYAFRGCTGLTSVTIGNAVTAIGERAFDYCSGLTSIKVETGNTNYDSRDNCNAIIETATNTLITGCKTTTIPNSVTSIGSYAFAYCSGLTSVTIGNSVTSIGIYAFEWCSGLTSVTIPNSVTSIGYWAFYECRNLTNIYSKILNPNNVTLGICVFDGVDKSSCILTVPAVSLNLYKAAAQWKDFLNIFPDVMVSSISLNKTQLILDKGQTETLTATVLPNDATYKTLNWTSSNTSVATVDQNGKVTAKAAGNATITATATDGSGVNASCRVTVNVPVSSITMSQTSANIFQNGTLTLTATVLPSDASNKTLTWSSSNTNVATVDQNGKVTAKAAGTATITATATDGSGVSASCLVTVVPDYSLTITPDVAHVRGTEQRTYELAINMSNRQAISGLQFNMKLPTGVSLATDSYGDYDIWLDNDRKARNHTWGVEPRANNSYFVLISSPTNRTFNGSTGAVLHLTVQIDKFHSSIGDYAITLSDIVMAEADETQHTATSSQSTVRLAYLVGDANADVEVDVADYVVTANYLLGRDTGSHFFTDAANAAYDNSTINVTDLVAITNIALELREKEIKPGVNGYQLAPAVTIPGTDYAVTAEVTGKNADMTVVSLDVDNDEPVAAMQLDLDLPEGVTLEAAEVTERAHGMTASCGSSPEGKARVVLSSFADYDIEAGRGSVLTLTLRGKANSGDLLRIIDMVMSERNLVEHGAMDNVTLDLSRVTAVNTAHYDRVNIYGRDGAVVIESPIDGAAKLVRLNGASQTVTVTAGRNVYPVDATRGDIIIATFNGTTTKLQF